MQISLKWVNELVDIKTVNLDNLIEKLTLSGFEVEEILEVKIKNKKTTTLDISATANRSDSLSIKGISLEISAILNKATEVSNYMTKTFNWTRKLNPHIKSDLVEKDCLGFISIVVENLNNLTSPDWLKHKLIYSGIIPENNLNDFQNYILLETGYPFEFYDLNKIYSKTKSSIVNLNLTSGKNIEKFIANDGSEYDLTDSILVLKANNFPISIAGIVANETVCWSNSTTSLLIEGSIFNSTKIRQQSRVLGLRTSRSLRYEKSLKEVNLLESFYRLILLLKISNPNLTCKLNTIAEPIKQELPSIHLNYKTVKKVLGPIKSASHKNLRYISPEAITDSLKRLTFRVNYNNSNNNISWDVTIPHLRSEDIVREIDLIEEIGRLYGFNNFLTRLPEIKKIGKEDYHYKTKKKFTSCLLNLGLNELIQYSLTDGETYSPNKITLINPLIKDYSNLRLTLLGNLLKTVQENLKKSNVIIEGFEYGHVFSGDILKDFNEKEYVAGIFGGFKVKSSWSHSEKLINWFEAKGKIEELFKKLNIIIYWKKSTSSLLNNILHPYCTAELYLINGKKLGDFGQIHPILAKKLNLSANLYLFEFDFELIQNQMQTTKLSIYQQYSFYPKIIKDLSFIINNKISFENLKKILYLNGTKFLKEINLLDEYQGVSIAKNHISLCLQLVFQSDEKTLENKKVETIIDHLKSVLTNKFDAILRI